MQITHTEKEFVKIQEKIKGLGKYHDLYVQSDTLLLADIFENFSDMSLKKYELDLARFTTALVLAWQAALKKTKVKFDLLTDIDILLMVEENIIGGYVTLFIDMQKLITNA